jgi:predicted CXXCH cytochrome family protein
MKTNHKRLLLIALFFSLLGGSGLILAAISNTKHNLSAGGPGTVKATTEQQICVFCHAPHNANPAAPLWNRSLSYQVSGFYTPYSSATLAATGGAAPGQPTGASKLCLSCHDGTVALGSVENKPGGGGAGIITMTGSLTAAANLGTNLANDHPVSFLYDAALAAKNPELVPPASLPAGKIKPDSSGQAQCTSCHDPHSDTYPKFMLSGYQDASGYGSPLCRTCHNKRYWGSLETVANVSHRESIAQWTGAGTNPWHIAGQNLALNANSTPKTNACESCHQPHTAPNNRLLKADGESGICLTCHNGTVANANKNIDAALNKQYVHPVKDTTRTGRHNPSRQADNKVRENQTDLNNRHAECADCHNPHAVSAGVSPTIPAVTNNLTSKVLKGVWGVNPTWPANWGTVTSYTVLDDTQYAHQICMKCHSYYAFGLSPPVDPYGNVPSTTHLLTDQAQEFNPNNASFHPVVQQGKNSFTFQRGDPPAGTVYDYRSSLINGMTPTSTMTCMECHSDADPAGTGAKGPHGSDVWPILWGPYNNLTGQTGTQNHVCFRCHDYNVYANVATLTQWQKTGYSNGAKNLHAYHVDKKNVPCIGCHSGIPHGWKRKRLLVFGRTLASDAGADPAPYNSHVVYKFDGSSDYGIPSNVGSKRGKTLDTITSGNWQQDDCHDGVPSISVGSCG